MKQVLTILAIMAATLSYYRKSVHHFNLKK